MTNTHADTPIPLTVVAVAAGTTDPTRWQRRHVQLTHLTTRPTTLDTTQRLIHLVHHTSGTFNSSL